MRVLARNYFWKLRAHVWSVAEREYMEKLLVRQMRGFVLRPHDDCSS